MTARTLRTRFIQFAIIGAVVVVLVYALIDRHRKSQETLDRIGTDSSLAHIAAALHHYSADHGTFPPAYIIDRHGNRHSWRVLILKFFNPELFAEYSFEEPWDGPNNSRLLHRMPIYYRNKRSSDDKSFHTSFLAITGTGCAFDGTKTTPFEEITDPLITTLIVVECSSLQVPWMAPIDLPLEEVSFRLNDWSKGSISTDREGRKAEPYGLFVDGTVRHLPLSLVERDIRAMASIRGGEGIDPISLELRRPR